MIGFGRALSGLRASEAGMRISTNNLTNSNTKGYKRQRLIQTEEISTAIGRYYIGLGARVDGVQQLYNQLKEDIYQDTLAKYGEYDTIDRTYDYVQTLTGTVGEGGMFKTATEDFWSSMNLLSTDTSSLTYRMSFLENAVSFMNQAQEIMDQLSSFQKEINEEIKGCVKDINKYAEEINKLNKKLAYYEAMDMDTNEVKDKRAYAIEQLSQIVEIDVENCRNGTSLAVRIGGGYLVSETKAYPVGLGRAKEGSIYDIPIWQDSGAKLDVKSGKLKGLLESRGYDVVANLEDPTNGSPKEKVDLVVTLDPLMDNDKIEEIRDKMSSMLDQMDRYQTDYKLYVNYVGYDGTYSFDNREEFEAFIQNSFYGDGNITNSMDAIKNIDYRDDASKYMMVFTDRPINGDASTTKEDLYSTIRTLNELDMRVIAVTNEDNNSSWRILTDATNGSTYDLANIESEEGFETIGLDFIHNANARLNDNDYGAIIPNVKAELNTFVNVLVREINALLKDGTNIYGETNTDGSLNMFVKIKEELPWQIGNIKINPLYADTNKIPLSLSGDVGDNRIMDAMVSLRESNVFADMNTNFTLDGFYSNFVLELGTNAGQALTNLANQENVVQDADDKRKQISAVSTDEELSNIIKYQYAYTASSKMINVLDEMLETMVSMI